MSRYGAIPLILNPLDDINRDCKPWLYDSSVSFLNYRRHLDLLLNPSLKFCVPFLFQTRTAPDHAADTSFSSLPEDCAQCVDLEIQADVHHRTMSFDSETAPETPDPNSNREPGISNGYSNQPEINGENTHCSNRSLTRIPEENCSSDKNGINNGINGSPEGNGHHSDLLNSHSKDSMKVNGPSYVIDNSLNEIHVDNSR